MNLIDWQPWRADCYASGPLQLLDTNIDVKTVLIVDNDLGFAFWLGHALDQAGFYALPAVSASGASKLLTELGLNADLVVINANLPDAASFIADLRLAQPALKVVTVVDDIEEPPPVFLQANLVEQKPIATDENARHDWVETIRMILSTNIRMRDQ
ncbi:MAG TPA: hypothetical protein VMS37_02980 [Verrucomicrobiae bacterium]|nr:hypothetical protein [Verrucomicrobiae bacterium]